MHRRDFVQGSAAAGAAGLAWFALLRQTAEAAAPLRPPGAAIETDFLARCVRCGQCVRACPYHTLTLGAVSAPGGSGTPRFVPRDVPCQLCEDIPCAKACPTGALDATLRDIRQARMGLAVVDSESCLSWQGLRCEVCYRVCPLRGQALTVQTHPRQISRHAVFVPVVHSNACTGCGLCEKQCPTEVAAIRIVDPKLVRGRIGAHYRPPAGSNAERAAPLAGDDTAPASPMRPDAVDYLNKGSGS